MAFFETLDRHKRELALINFALIVVTSLFWIFLSGGWEANQNFDYKTYYEPVARRVLAGDGLREANGRVAAHYPPGYSLLIAGVFDAARRTGIPESAAMKVFILFCNVCTGTLLYLLTVRLFDRTAALAAALLWITYPFFLWLSKQPNTETPFLPFFLAAIYTYVGFWPKRISPERPALLTGLLIGFASLVRAIAVAFGFVLAAFVLYARRDLPLSRRLLVAALLIAGNLLAIAPWEVWVYAVGGEKVVLGRDSSNSILDGVTFGLHPQASGVLLPVHPSVRRLMQDAESRSPQVNSIGRLGAFLAEWAAREPVTVARFLFLKAKRAWMGTQAQWGENWISLLQIPYLIAFAAAGILLLRQPGSAPRSYALLATLTTAYFWMMAMLVLPLLRYMIPAICLLMVLAGVLVTSMYHRLRRHTSESRLQGSA